MMRKLLLFAMIAALCGGALAYAQSTPVDHPGICPAIERDWRQVAVAGTPATYARDGDALLFTYGSDGPALRYEPCAD